MNQTPHFLETLTKQVREKEEEWDATVTELIQHPRTRPYTLGHRLSQWVQNLRKAPTGLGNYHLTPSLRQETSAKAWAKRWPSADYREVTPVYHGEFPPQDFLIPNPVFDAPWWRRTAFTVPATFILELPFGRTMGLHGATMTHDHYLLDELSREFFLTPKEHPLYRTRLFPPIRKLEGRHVLLAGPGNSTYHWFYDLVVRAALLQQAGYTWGDFDGVILRKPKYSAHDKMIDLMGIPREKIIWCGRYRQYEADRLVVPSYTNNEREHHPLGYEYLRKLVPVPPLTSSSTSPRKRLYLSRRDAKEASRQISNEEEVEAFLRERGFESITLADLSLEEQAHAFASAEIIVAPHGGGLSNLCFAQAPMTLIELFAPDYTPTYFRAIAQQMGFDYQPLLGESVGDTAFVGGNIRVDLQRLEFLVSAAEASSKEPRA